MRACIKVTSGFPFNHHHHLLFFVSSSSRQSRLGEQSYGGLVVVVVVVLGPQKKRKKINRSSSSSLSQKMKKRRDFGYEKNAKFRYERTHETKKKRPKRGRGVFTFTFSRVFTFSPRSGKGDARRRGGPRLPPKGANNHKKKKPFLNPRRTSCHFGGQKRLRVKEKDDDAALRDEPRAAGP